ncbi:MAG: DNA-directed RNA polymerase subunit D [Infirmifilum sp.]
MSNTPSLRVLSSRDNTLEIVLEGTTPAFANSLRRAIISEVPTLAIDEVIFTENTSVFWDEMIAHRLALIPLKMDVEIYDALRDCYEKRGTDCQVIFSLYEEAVERPKTVFSGHLRFEGVEGITLPNKEFVIAPVSKYIPIIKLNKGQRLVLTAIARMGVGRDHAKWQPVSAVGYKYKPVIRILKPEIPEEEANKVINVCPRRIFGYTGGRLVVLNENACSLCRECVEKFPSIVQVEGDRSTIMLSVESIGSLPPSKILDVAIEILSQRLENLYSKTVEAVNAFLAPTPSEEASSSRQSF